MSQLRIHTWGLALAFLLSCLPSSAQITESGQLVRNADGQVLTSTAGVNVSIEVSEPYRHVGGQRFVLRGHTDVEQHFFVVADSNGDVDQMYWIQFEEKLPHNEGPYSYPSDAKTSIGDFAFVTHVRHYDTEPVDDSDRGAAYRFLAEQGYRVPTPAIRCRLVHIPDGDGRQELMIVYLESSEESGEIAAAVAEELQSRAVAGLTMRPAIQTKLWRADQAPKRYSSIRSQRQ